jgi:hypothetical protein
MKRKIKINGLALLSLSALSFAMGACSNGRTEKIEAYYGPTESLIEVIAVLRRHIPDDTYRFPPATDFTGRNVYRSSLLRLESIERVQADPLRSGYMDPAIDFSKGRSLERLRAYQLAALHYRRAAQRESGLRDEAEKSAIICERIEEAVGVGLNFTDPLAPPSDATPAWTLDLKTAVSQLEERVALLSLLSDEVERTHYQAIISEEIERADEIRAAYFVRQRFDLPDGQIRAIAEMRRMNARHVSSKKRLRHMIDLANLYDELAHEYVEAVPPQDMNFDPALFQDLVDPATQLYQSVASNDGTVEKLEAARKLEAFLAFTLLVDNDRFVH